MGKTRKVSAVFLSIVIVVGIISAPRAYAAAPSTVQEEIYTGLYNYASEIDISKYNIRRSDIESVMRSVTQDSPELFYVSTVFYYYYIIATDVVTSITPQYKTASWSEMQNQRMLYNAEMKRIVSLADPGWSDFEKCLFAHDYIAENAEYVGEVQYSDAYSILIYNKGLCQAYTLAYTAILRELGVEVSNVVSNTMNHTWNIVKLDGLWYHVDVTWDDPVADRLGQAQHNNFLLSDAAIAKTGHRDWYRISGETPRCTDTRYDHSFWREVTTAFQYADGSWYYISSESNGEAGVDFDDLLGVISSEYGLYKWDKDTHKRIADLNYEWNVWGSIFSYWKGFYSGTAIIDGEFYFNTPTAVMKYNLRNGMFSTVYTPDTSSGYIYGTRFDGDTVYYALSTTPDTSFYNIKTFSLHSDSFQYGDLNGDGLINGMDSILLLQYLAIWDVTININAADINRDGKISGADSTVLLQYLAGWDIAIN